ncbi:MAG TPA: inositol monophosphatase family protein, partial [Bacteroidales bacterium]|nr:inositol monophosphatase family protein [Bacteroidales bacterium]
MTPRMINLRDQEVLLTGMAEAAQEAGIYLIGEQQGLGMEAVEVKGRNDFVSYVDRESERRIVRRLKALLPGAGFWAEEEARMDGDGDARWIIDPLDGTTNYIHGLPLYAVSIALENRGQVVAGLVYEPVHAEMFTAA